MGNETKVVTKSFPLVGVLTVIFVVAKLFHVIAWPWWIVLAGLWAPLAFLAVVLVVVLLFALALAAFGK